MRWRRVIGYKNYLINDLGMVYSKKTDKFLKPYVNPSGVLYVSLSNNGVNKMIPLDRLVLNHFQPSQTTINVYAWHKDLELENVANNNLKRCSRGDRRRMFFEIKGKQRGIYPWTIGKNKFRVALKGPDKKYITVGYYKTELYAKLRYVQAYKKLYGRAPY